VKVNALLILAALLAPRPAFPCLWSFGALSSTRAEAERIKTDREMFLSQFRVADADQVVLRAKIAGKNSLVESANFKSAALTESVKILEQALGGEVAGARAAAEKYRRHWMTKGFAKEKADVVAEALAQEPNEVRRLHAKLREEKAALDEALRIGTLKAEAELAREIMRRTDGNPLLLLKAAILSKRPGQEPKLNAEFERWRQSENRNLPTAFKASIAELADAIASGKPIQFEQDFRVKVMCTFGDVRSRVLVKDLEKVAADWGVTGITFGFGGGMVGLSQAPPIAQVRATVRNLNGGYLLLLINDETGRDVRAPFYRLTNRTTRAPIGYRAAELELRAARNLGKGAANGDVTEVYMASETVMNSQDHAQDQLMFLMLRELAKGNAPLPDPK